MYLDVIGSALSVRGLGGAHSAASGCGTAVTRRSRRRWYTVTFVGNSQNGRRLRDASARSYSDLHFAALTDAPLACPVTRRARWASVIELRLVGGTSVTGTAQVLEVSDGCVSGVERDERLLPKQVMSFVWNVL